MKKKEHHNAKVARNRGSKWKQNLVRGRLDVQMNPSKLRLKRFHKDRTQKQIADSCGIVLTTYCAIERGVRPAKAELAKKICKYLNIPQKSLKEYFTENENGKYFAVKS
jgi:DNA-binding XRE family transcriptional regulator